MKKADNTSSHFETVHVQK